MYFRVNTRRSAGGVRTGGEQGGERRAVRKEGGVAGGCGDGKNGSTWVLEGGASTKGGQAIMRLPVCNFIHVDNTI
jgi:hypothetical protein